MLARSLGVTQLVVVLNKMEKVDYSQERYYEIHDKVQAFLLSIGFKSHDLYFLPISAIQGENLMTKASDPRLTSWYGTEEDHLIGVLDNLRLPQRTFTRPLRVTVTDYM